MGEYVQQTLEEMTNEVQQLERVGLFDHTEIRPIVSKRKRYEYKLRRRVKDKQDFLAYITFETRVIALIDIRRKINGYRYKKAEIEGAIQARISKLFFIACRNWPQDYELWTARIKYAKENEKNKSAVSSLYTKMLQLITDRPSLWIQAAKYEFEVIYSIDTARDILLRGVSYNKNAHQLWLEFFRLELLFVDFIRRRKKIKDAGLLRDIGIPKFVEEDDITEDVLSGETAKAIFKHALKQNPDCYDLSVGFIPIAKMFEWTNGIENCIFDTMFHTFSHLPELWELKISRIIDELDPNSPDFKEKFLAAEDKCETLLKAMMRHAGPSEQSWSIYLSVAYRLLNFFPHPDSVYKFLTVLGLVEQQGCLTETWMIRWIELFSHNGGKPETLNLFDKAVRLFPSSGDLWAKYMQFAVTHSETGYKEAIKIFHKSRKVKEDTPLVWKTILSLCAGRATADELSKLYETGILSNDTAVASSLKSQYLHWTFCTKEMKEVRVLYNRLKQMMHVPKDFYKMYIKTELSQCEPEMVKVRKAYRCALHEHGADSLDLWLDNIALEKKLGEADKTSRLYSQAIKRLESDKVQDFMLQHVLQSSI